jgi:hypothetical protein
MKLCWLVISYQPFQISTNNVPVNTPSCLEHCNLHQLISPSLLPLFIISFHQLSHMPTRLSICRLPACHSFLYPLLL